jgi:hypothetical protein
MSGGFPAEVSLCHDSEIGIVIASTAGTTVPIGTGAYGAWTQLTASAPIDATHLLVNASFLSGPSVGCIWKIGFGASGSEVAVATDVPLSVWQGSSGDHYGFCLIPLNIPAGTRVSVAAKGNAGDTAKTKFNLLEGAFGAEGVAGYDGFSSTTGTSISPSATANTKGSFAQLVASTAKDYSGLLVILNARGGTSLAIYAVDIAIGSSGNETVVVNNLMAQSALVQFAPLFIPMEIPAGTRISARCQSTATSGAAIIILAAGAYK